MIIINSSHLLDRNGAGYDFEIERSLNTFRNLYPEIALQNGDMRIEVINGQVVLLISD